MERLLYRPVLATTTKKEMPNFLNVTISPFLPLQANLQVTTLWPARLLQVEVEHDGYSTAHVWPQERLLDLCCEVVEGGQGLSGESEI